MDFILVSCVDRLIRRCVLSQSTLPYRSCLLLPETLQAVSPSLPSVSDSGGGDTAFTRLVDSAGQGRAVEPLWRASPTTLPAEHGHGLSPCGQGHRSSGLAQAAHHTHRHTRKALGTVCPYPHRYRPSPSSFCLILSKPRPAALSSPVAMTRHRAVKIIHTFLYCLRLCPYRRVNDIPAAKVSHAAQPASVFMPYLGKSSFGASPKGRFSQLRHVTFRLPYGRHDLLGQREHHSPTAGAKLQNKRDK